MALKYKTGELDEALQIVEQEGYHELSAGEKASLAGQLVVTSAIRELWEKLDDLESQIFQVQQAVAMQDN